MCCAPDRGRRSAPVGVETGPAGIMKYLYDIFLLLAGKNTKLRNEDKSDKVYHEKSEPPHSSRIQAKIIQKRHSSDENVPIYSLMVPISYIAKNHRRLRCRVKLTALYFSYLQWFHFIYDKTKIGYSLYLHHASAKHVIFTRFYFGFCLLYRGTVQIAEQVSKYLNNSEFVDGI